MARARLTLTLTADPGYDDVLKSQLVTNELEAPTFRDALRSCNLVLICHWPACPHYSGWAALI